MDLKDLRRDYLLAGLAEADLAASPFDQFSQWFDVINLPDTIDSSAMVLATVNTSGQVSQRTVLLKSFDKTGFCFYSNYESQKGVDIAANNRVSLIFSWHQVERQVIIHGEAHKVSEQDSDAYFALRPRDSQIAAWVSRQSKPVSNRRYLSETFESLQEAWQGQTIPRPPYWGGYNVVPSRFEFWQGRAGRLHDRLVYSRDNAAWVVSRLAP